MKTPAAKTFRIIGAPQIIVFLLAACSIAAAQTKRTVIAADTLLDGKGKNIAHAK